MTYSLSYLAPLLSDEWTTGTTIDILQTLLPVVQVMPIHMQKQLFQVYTTVETRNIFLPTSNSISDEGRTQLHHAFSQSIATSWKLFLSISNAQMLALGQTQLSLVQQSHTLLYPSVRPFLYAGVHSLVGMALHFQEHNREALQAHQNAYMAALATYNPQYIVASLISQADSLHALRQYELAIQTLKEALPLTAKSNEKALIRLKAHLLTCWADNSMMLKDFKTAQEKLEAAEEYLTSISINEEFDQASWHLLAGKYALLTKSYNEALEHFQTALAGLPERWMLRRMIVSIGLTKAYAKMKERERSLSIADNLVSMLKMINAPVTNRWFAEYLREDLLDAFPTDVQVRAFIADIHRRMPQLVYLYEE